MKVRIPLVGTQTNRTAYIIKDVDIVNMYVDKDATGKEFLRQRPGFQLYKDFTGGTPQGLCWFNDAVHAVISDTIYHNTQAVNLVADATAWSSRVATPKWGIAGGGRAIVFKNRLWYFGGKMVVALTYRNLAYSTLDGDNWIEASVANPWAARGYFGLVEFAGKLWAFGGITDGGTILKDVWCSDDGVHWEFVTGSAPWGQRYAFGYVAVNNGIYVIGGIGTAADEWLSDVWFTSDGITWTQVKADDNDANLRRRAWSPCLYYNNKLFMLFGQYRTGAVTTTIDEVAYSEDGGKSWSKYSAASGTARFAGGACVYNDKMFYLGGNAAGYIDDIISSTTGAATWTSVSTSPGWGARQEMAVAVWQTPTGLNTKRARSIWIIGGEGSASYYDIQVATPNVASASSHALTVTTSFERMRFDTINNGQLLVFKNLHKLWVYDGYSVIEINNPNVPKKMVDGIAILNDTVYVMDAQGTIYNSRLTDPFTWNSLDFIQAEHSDDEGLFIAKHLNYIVAIKSRSIQFFQDVGNPLGSPLAPMLNYILLVGCATSKSIAQIDNMIVFVSTGGSWGPQVQILDGLQLRVISTPAIDRILENNSTILSASAMKFGGHFFYILQTSGIYHTLVCDITTGLWYRWASGDESTENYQAFDLVSNGASATLLLDRGSTGNVYWVRDDWMDELLSFQVRVTTQPHDFGERTRKFMSRLELICDKTVGSTSTTIDWSDDDYQTWSTAATVSEGAHQPAIWRCGSFRRRAFRVSRLVDGNYMPRWEAIEVDIDKGTG